VESALDSFESPVVPVVPAAAHDAVREAVEDWYLRHADDIFRYLLVLTRLPGEADDVTSETFTRALAALRHGSSFPDKPLPWLITIARHIATDRWRRTVRRFATVLEPARPDSPEAAASRAFVESLVRALPQHQREVVVLRYIRDLSDAEIAGVLHISESGVRSLAARALGTLRQHEELWK
jgi:RNA polymerase sigma-70 factor, ECF subfamily